MGVAATLAAAATLTACSGGASAQIDYVVDGTLGSYNTNTVVGAASAGAQAFARTLIGFGYHGPDGQVVADHDFGTISVVGGAPLVLDYQIADNAVYSDGQPVTCDDMVLTWAAQSGRFPGFDANTQAGYADIANIECMPGQKKARVSFIPDRSVVDYTQLFTTTTMMPSHVIADQLNIDVTAALLTKNASLVDQIAKLWNTIWDLKPSVDLKRFPASGPYKIQSVLDKGGVVLVANDRWWGPKPITKRITVWTQEADIQDRVNSRSVDVVDVAAGSSGSLATPDNFQRTDSPSAGIEQLIFSSQGPLALARERHALALCTPRDVIAHDAGVPIANSRLSPANEDAIALADGANDAGPFGKADPAAARDSLHGTPLTVRIGYQGPNARLAATVGTIAKSCAAAGVNVSGVALDPAKDPSGPQALRDGKIDVLLASTGGATGSGSTGSSALDAYDLHTGNGNNLSNYANPQIDGIIGGLAVSADPAERVRLLAEAAPVLWGDMPTLPLYRQQRTLLMSKKMYAVSRNPTRWGAGWNMDRWALMQ
jgi:peptide/nickel transport system substrate-binding protein